MTPLELNQWQSNTLSLAVPAVAVEGPTLFVNYLGHIFALDLESGKILWRTGSFHNLELLAMQPIGQMLDPSRFAIVAAGEHVWTLGRDVKDPNPMAPFQLTCRRADNGEVVWKSSDLADYAALDLVGMPLLADGKLFIAGQEPAEPPAEPGPAAAVGAGHPAPRRQDPLEDGGRLVPPGPADVLLRADARHIAASRGSPTGRGRSTSTRTSGILARLDADSGTLDWGYGYQTDAFQSMYRSSTTISRRSRRSGPALRSSSGEALLIKGMQSDRLYAIDPDRMKVLWERPIAKASRLLGRRATAPRSSAAPS